MPSLVRRTTRVEARRVGYGGGVTIYGAPTGGIKVEAWSRPEVEVTAEVELRADTEEELARLAEVNTFTLDHDASRLRLLTVGTHDRKYMKRAAKNFPKKLLTAPWRIDYTLRVPAFTDVEIQVGRGAVEVAGVEGALRLNVAEGDATFTLAGGDVVATVGRGQVLLRPTARSWRGRGIELRLGAGDLVAELPAGFNADLDARVLQAGNIENGYGDLTPSATAAPSGAPATHALRGRFGAGGAVMSLTVGSGTIRLRRAPSATADKN